MKHLINQVLGLAVRIMIHFNGRIKKKYFIFTYFYCKTSFVLHMTFCMPQSALHNLPDFLNLCVGVESVSKIL